MRYILDNNGYVELCSETHIECNGRGCTEYTGEVPAGYESLEDWAINANIRAYKIVDGNLVYDANRCSILEAQFEKEAEENRYVCYKEISNITNILKTDNVDAYKRSTTGLLSLLEVIDSNKYASDFIKLVANENLTGSVTLKFNNGNLLTNDATSKTESGISFVANADRSITINGTATEDIEFNIGGTNTNTKPILALKKGTNYYLSSNGYQIKMYNYDGTDRTEVYNGTGGIIILSANSQVTNIVLAIASGTTVNTTIYPMLNLGTEANGYVTYQGNESTIYLADKTFNVGDNIAIESGIPVLQNEVYVSNNLIIGDFTIGGVLTELDSCVMPYTYLDKTYMYVYENANLAVTYPNTEKDLDLCGYETPNSGFGVDEKGNMYCNNATINGSAITDGAIYLEDLENGNNVLSLEKMYNLEDDMWYGLISMSKFDGTSTDIQPAYITLTNSDGNNNISLDGELGNIYVYQGDYLSYMDGGNVGAYNFVNLSLEEKKKNFELLTNAIDVIKKGDIYSYNWKQENDEDKKHIGLVIGENYNTPNEVLSKNNQSIDLYSMISICWKAIQEQQKQIEDLKEEIKQLKESE